MRTVPLLRGIIRIGLASLTVALLLSNGFIYLTVRHGLNTNLERSLDERVELVAQLARDTPLDRAGLEALRERLHRAGLRGRIVSPRSDMPFTPVLDPPNLGGDEGAQSPPRALLSGWVQLPNDVVVEVGLPRDDVDVALLRLARVQVVGSGLALIAAWLLISLGSRRALRPLDAVVETAESIARGEHERRLKPDRADTEMGRMALAFDRMVDALETAIREREEAEAKMSAFLADTAHQLRSPLTGLLAALDATHTGQDGAVKARMLAIARREGIRTRRLLTDLLRMARLDVGEKIGETELCDVATLCELEAQRLEVIDFGTRIELYVSTDALVPARPESLREAIGNILENCARHAAGIVRVIISEAHGDSVEISVSDDGLGVPPELEERIFERLFSEGDHRGSGLGLPIARAIVQQQGGELAYRRDRGFVLRLPSQSPNEH